MKATQKLRQLLTSDGIIVAGGAHDALSARIVEDVGFQLCVVMGAGLSMVRGYCDVAERMRGKKYRA